MCGICGILNHDPDSPVDREVLSRVARTMIHRGPDDEGFLLDCNIGMGHRRLSIIDLTTGRQPIHNEDETVWIVFNGEIYNAPELRARLEKEGHLFYTRTDTEVIVHAFEQYGTDCLDELNGIFSFGIWDSRRKVMFLARDRAGVKPLYYAEPPGAFVFGSELRAVLAHPAIERHLDMTSLNQYLAYEYVPTPRTIFAGVKKLPPGHCLTLENGRLKLECYWDISLQNSEPPEAGKQTDYAAGFRRTLDDAVRLELLSDVPVGVLLSGGLDSSAVAAAMVRSYPGKVQSFSIIFDDPSFDESRYARQVSKHLGTEHHELLLDPRRSLQVVERLGEFLDEPLADSSWIPTIWLAQFTSKHVKVALSGDGGDELFGGYPTLLAHRFVPYYQALLPEWVRKVLVPRFVDRLPVSFDYMSFEFKLRRFLTGQSAPPVVRHHLWIGSFSGEQRNLLLSPTARRDNGNVEDVALNLARNCGAREVLNHVLYCDIKLFLEGCVLAKMDRASMAHSLEVRVPLLNHLFLRFSENLPAHWKLRGTTSKYIMREALKGILPPDILKRRKQGFNMPMAKWLSADLRPLAEHYLSKHRLKRAGLFNPDYVHTLWQEHLARRRDHRKLLWTLLAFELWYDKWMK